MPQVSYLSGEETFHIDYWNDLFAALDEKLSRMLDDHSLLFSYGNGNYIEGSVAYKGRDSTFWIGNLSSNTLSPLYNSESAFHGRCFFFTSGNPFFCKEIFAFGREDDTTTFAWHTFWPRNYDHTVFTQLAQSLPEFSDVSPYYDTGKKLLRVQSPTDEQFYSTRAHYPLGIDSLLDFSLEVHTRDFVPPETPEATPEKYRLVTGYNTYPEMVHKTAQAEIVIEGPASVTFPANYNKYNFFRVHNLGANATQLIFRGTDGETVFTLSVPARGSRCVRRDDVDSGYLEGYNHFQKFKEGDARHYNRAADMIGFHGDWGLNNNVANPSLVFRLVQDFHNRLHTTKGCGWLLDYTRFWDASTHYQGTFGTFSDGRIIGELLHHPGNLAVTSTVEDVTSKTEFEFRGYGSFTEDMAAGGITVSEVNGNLELSKAGSCDLISVSTNLIDSLFGQPVKLLSPNLTLNMDVAATPLAGKRAGSSSRPTAPYVSTPNSFTFLSWNATTNSYENKSFPQSVLNLATGTTAPTENYRLHRLTGAELKGLNLFGLTQFDGTNQNNAITQHKNIEFRMTGLGPILTWDEEITLSAWPDQNLTEFFNGGTLFHGTNTGSLSDGKITFKHAYQLNKGGWPALSILANTPNERAPIYSYNGAFHSPVADRKFSFNKRAKTWGTMLNPWTANQRYRLLCPDFTVTEKTGEDAEVLGLNGVKKSKSVNYLCPHQRDNNNAMLDAYLNSYLYEAKGEIFTTSLNFGGSAKYTDIRAALQAGTIVDIEFYKQPVCFNRIPMTIEHFNNLASLVNSIYKIKRLDFQYFFRAVMPPDETATFLGFLRPFNSYASSAAAIEKAESIGITCKTSADFPAIYNELQSKKSANLVVRYSATTVVTPISSSPVINEASTTFGVVSQTLTDSSTLLWQGSGLTFSGKWIRVEDVAALAESLGFLFNFKQVGVPLDVRIEEPSAVANSTPMLDRSPTQLAAGYFEANAGAVTGRFLAFVPGNDWLMVPPVTRVQSYDTPVISLKVNVNSGFTHRPNYPNDTLFRNYYVIFLSGEDMFYGYMATEPATGETPNGFFDFRHGNVTPDRNSVFTNLLFRNYGGGASVIVIPSPSVRWTYSVTDFKDSRFFSTATVIPAEGSPTTISLQEGDNIVEAQSACDDLLLFVDETENAD